jgi:hypothetical protein
LVAAENGFFTTSWPELTGEPRITGLNGAVPYSVTSMNQKIWLGTDRGVFVSDREYNWTLDSPLPSRGPITWLVAFGSELIAGTPNGIFESDDLGAKWTQPQGALGRGTPIAEVAHSADTVVAASASKLYRRRDSDWIQIGDLGVRGNVVSLAILDGERLVLQVIDPRGVSKVAVFRQGTGSWEETPSAFSQITTAPVVAGKWVYVGTKTGVGRWKPGDHEWTSASDGVGQQQIGALLFSPDGQLYAATASGIYVVSGSRKPRWSKTGSTLGQIPIVSIWSRREIPRMQLLSTPNGLYYSDNRGLVYTLMAQAPRLDGFFRSGSIVESADRLFAATDGGVFYLYNRLSIPVGAGAIVESVQNAYSTYATQPWFWLVNAVSGVVLTYLTTVVAILVLSWTRVGAFVGRSWLLGSASKAVQTVPRAWSWALFV